MRVLWFTNIPMAAVNERFGRPTSGNGFWMHALIEPLSRMPGLQLGVATAGDDPNYHFEKDGVQYFNIHQQKVLETFHLFRKTRLNRYLRKAAEIVEAFKPDLIHVHGTERFFGLVRSRGLTRVPTVVSIQHVLSQMARFSWGEMRLRDIIGNTTAWEFSRNATMFAELRRLDRHTNIEKEILTGVQAALGRTEWDHSHVRRVSPKLSYFHVDEVMRPQFAASKPWDIANIRRLQLLTTTSSMPIKGLPVLFRAVAALRSWGYDVKLQVAGLAPEARNRAPDRFAIKLIKELDLQPHVELLGWCDAQSLIQRQLASHCFITPSYSENGCNALSEAMLVGMPCVASHAGGLTTTIASGQSGLLFSPGDEAMLARQLERVLLDDDLATRLGQNARTIGLARHDPGKIVAALIDAYEKTVQNNAPPASVKAMTS